VGLPITSKSFTLPFESITLNFIIKLHQTKTYGTLLTITDTFFKASIFIPYNKTIDAEHTALLYATYILPHYQLPSKMISDCDPQFTSSFTRELCRLLQVDQNISMAYNPQTNSQSEQTNQWLEQYLHIFSNFHQNNWSSWLPLAQYTHNSWPNMSTKKAPFELIMRHIPHVHQTKRIFKSLVVANRLLQHIKEAQQQALEAVKCTQELTT
jgi:hypothetical protein